jgi:hypothetical protein
MGATLMAHRQRQRHRQRAGHRLLLIRLSLIAYRLSPEKTVTWLFLRQTIIAALHLKLWNRLSSIAYRQSTDACPMFFPAIGYQR